MNFNAKSFTRLSVFFFILLFSCTSVFAGWELQPGKYSGPISNRLACLPEVTVKETQGSEIAIMAQASDGRNYTAYRVGDLASGRECWHPGGDPLPGYHCSESRFNGNSERVYENRVCGSDMALTKCDPFGWSLFASSDKTIIKISSDTLVVMYKTGGGLNSIEKQVCTYRYE